MTSQVLCMCVCVYRLPDVLSGGCLLSAPIGEDLWRVPVRFQLLFRTHHEAAEETKEKKDSPTAKNDGSQLDNHILLKHTVCRSCIWQIYSALPSALFVSGYLERVMMLVGEN